MRRDDGGVSSVVAAVLLFALFSTAFMVYSFQSLPGWEADNEHAAHRAVAGDLQGLKAGLEALSARGDAGPVGATVPLAVPTVAVLQPDPATADLAFLDGGSGLAVTASLSSPRLHLVDGAAAGAPDAPIGNTVLADIASLDALSVALATASVGPGDSATLQVAASDGTAAASFTLTHVGSQGATTCAQGGELRAAVTDALGTTTQTLLCGPSSTLPSYKVDVLTPIYGFGAALARLQAPFSLTLSTATTGSASATGTYMGAWLDSGGVQRLAGNGQATTFSVDQSGGRLVYAPRYTTFPSEQLAFEGGALLAVQDSTRQAVVADPSFSLEVADGVAHLGWTLVELDGSGSASGPRDATVTLTHRATTDVVLSAGGGTFTLQTPGAAAWRSFFSDRALLAGIPGQAVAGGTGSTATLTLATGGTVTSWVLHLRLVQASVAVT